jgi:hypothetical protein
VSSPTEIVHIASQAVQIGPEIRQRCVWCGYEITAVDLRLIAVQIEHANDPYPTWPGGGLIAVDGPATYVVEHKDGDKLPSTFCGAPDDLSAMYCENPACCSERGHEGKCDERAAL